LPSDLQNYRAAGRFMGGENGTMAGPLRHFTIVLFTFNQSFDTAGREAMNL